MTEWADVAFVLGVLLLGALVITVVAWQVSSVLRARTTRAQENEYDVLALRAVENQEQTLAELAALRSRVDALRSRVDALDEILRQVD